MYPIRFEPVYQSYVWGGDRIPKKFHRSVPPGRYAESWEVSDRPDGMSVAANGPWKGRDLHSLVSEWKDLLMGKGRHFSQFPLLIKIIDAKENLSIQVHPDEKTAKRLGGEPKTESWVVLHDGFVYAGLKHGADQERLRKAIQDQAVEGLIEKIGVKEGDAVYIPAGRVHAIGEGCLLLEVQQNSNTTYRLYDWGRTGRELHIEQAFASIHWMDPDRAVIAPRPIETDSHYVLESLIRSPFFLIDRAKILDHWNIPADPKTFQIFFCAKGEGTIEADGLKEPFRPGMTYLVPAAARSIRIEGSCQTIRISLS